MGKSKQKRKVYDYFMSMDYGMCHGPVDSINAIEIKEKDAWVGPAMSDGEAAVNNGDLFGGDDGEGGPIGTVELYMGDYDQVMSDALAARHGLTATTAPGYRGIAHVFFRGGAATGDPGANEGVYSGGLGNFGTILFGLFYGNVVNSSGFRWTSNNPYLPPAVINATRGPKGLTESLIYPIVGMDEAGEYIIAGAGDAFIVDADSGARSLDRTRLPDANPAAMVFEAMTNSDWGKGEPLAAFDIASYEACAATFKAEHFGLTMLYMQQDSIENYVSEVLDHVLAVQYQDPTTGLWTLKAIRDDYNIGDCLVLTPQNCTVSSLRTKTWGETINDIKVSYTDPVSGDEETVTAQNLANIAIQGGVVSDPRDYHGIRNPYLAKFVAERDVASSSRALLTATVSVNREAYNQRPADVVVLVWPEEEVDHVPFRVMGVNYGKPKDRTIVLELVEDVFGTAPLRRAAASQPVIDYDLDPLPKNPDTLFLMTPPLPPLIRGGLDVEELDANYPQSEVQFLISDSTVEFLETQVESAGVLPNGALGQVIIGTVPPSFPVSLDAGLGKETRSVLSGGVISTVTGALGEIGDLFVIGSDEARHELIMLDSYSTEDEAWTVLRGMYDTVPLDWAAGRCPERR
jgi:hypothetical protein